MTTILRIDASIKGDASVTRRLGDKIVARLQADHPGATLMTRDVSAGIPLIDGAWIGAAYTPADQRNAAQKAQLALSDELIAELKAADVVVIGMPVYNFGITGPLKAWIDQICRVGETFVYTEAGPQGLVTGPRVIAAYASGGVPQGSANDLATPYLRQVLGFIGITDVRVIAAAGVAVDEAAALARAETQIAALAA
ncbi:FMN-dependent NADH-azoreductase [Rhodobacter veldkampii DSM 11550]|uniref:FMN dependent NADH:quinone oxidoreductase n=1 Tax=Phaeovulum veldkampii DSM 11550 TaxID=1185920 RepID=A0A2T4JLR3_9RHOB|nr:NAD(P)H-dependent oxidoreductase [Phaeovulum veldkampii]MBK5946643.1 FMN-dependent NADH-azoreductase [Phaeovulum veldkampii DSM 11550]PTE18803.1 FMN-dependent NADH-azoreductase [Phaeovulum veldkampii DSM 11550]TDQ59978.1 FMN-dependent NADH-azoreductase [Phaeovulum veldkampii DSM 11550]